MTFTLKQLEAFIWLASFKNFRKTAEKLHTTQPAISSRIASLESYLDVKLFERQSGVVQITPRGQELLPYAERILKISSQLYEQAGGFESMTGILRIGVSETIVHTKLPKFLTALHDQYPNVDVEITVDVTTNLRDELITKSLDLAILMGPVSEYQIENLSLSSFPLVWAASPSLGIDVNHRQHVADLSHFPLLTYARNTRPYVEIQNYLRNQDNLFARMFPSSSLAASLRMAIDGVGVGIFPKELIQSHLTNHELIEIPCQWTPSELSFTASYSSFPPNPLAEVAAKVAQNII